jgi:tRNA A-37 threonylcarbamoyl transferase component Bud32/Tol biopolymer transport system component
VSADFSRLAAALADRYRIERELGQGGMATVYLAHDLKHDRKVAVKVLRPELAAVIGAERFLAEIKTTANLQHPHILALHDSGEVNGTVFYVMPYVEGESLRDRLGREKQLPVDDALRIAGEVADALQSAHEHGVIHRDIKPENILLQRGHAVVTDFGIALAAAKTGGTRMTETGMSLGTPTYMSPEQAMGERGLDARTDVYALGCVLYEMLAGEPPFSGPTAQAIVAKVMTEDPKGLTAQRRSVPLHVNDAVNTALEKLPADRFASAAQFAEALRGTAPSLPSHRHSGAPMARSRWVRWAATAAACLLIGAGGYLLGRGRGTGTDLDPVSFTQRTFSTEAVFTARFSSDGQTIVYSAAAEGATPRLFVIRSDYPEPRPIGDAATHLLSVSSRDELAVLVRAHYLQHRIFTGTLARMPLGGGAPRELLADVREADWAPDGSDLAIIHEVDGKDRLEYPQGKVLYESPGYLSDLRFAPDGGQIAFLEHPGKWDDRGGVAVVDLRGRHRMLTEGYWGLEGVAWTPDGKRVLFGGALEGGFYQVHDVTLSGKAHLVLPSAGTITVQDISRTGRWLLTRDDIFFRLMAKRPQDQNERDLSWLDNSALPILSADGQLLAFSDEAADAGANYATMIRKTDGSPAVRLGEGTALAVSRDKNWILSVVPTSPQQLVLYPTGPGQSRRLDQGEFDAYPGVAFFPDGANLLICGRKAEHAARCYVRPVADGPLRPITPEGVGGGFISPDGRRVLARLAADGYRLYPMDGSASQPVPGITPGDKVLRWSPDGRTIWIQRSSDVVVRVEQLDLASGRRAPLMSVRAGTGAGLLGIGFVQLADDPRGYAYIASEYVSHIFDVRGMR